MKTAYRSSNLIYFKSGAYLYRWDWEKSEWASSCFSSAEFEIMSDRHDFKEFTFVNEREFIKNVT